MNGQNQRVAPVGNESDSEDEAVARVRRGLQLNIRNYVLQAQAGVRNAELDQRDAEIAQLREQLQQADQRKVALEAAVAAAQLDSIRSQQEKVLAQQNEAIAKSAKDAGEQREVAARQDAQRLTQQIAAREALHQQQLVAQQASAQAQLAAQAAKAQRDLQREALGIRYGVSAIDAENLLNNPPALQAFIALRKLF